jgi:hypothetical protein
MHRAAWSIAPKVDPNTIDEVIGYCASPTSVMGRMEVRSSAVSA